MPQHVGDGQRAQRADGVHEERVGAVERVDVAAIGQPGPPFRLHRAADLQGELVEAQLPGRRVDPALARQPPQPAVGADVVEPVVVHADVRQVRRHPLDGARPAQLQEFSVAGGVELQDCRAELKSLSPFRPAARLVAALDGEHGRAGIGRPGRFERADLARRQLEHPIDLGQQVARREVAVYAHAWSPPGQLPTSNSQLPSGRGSNQAALGVGVGRCGPLTTVQSTGYPPRAMAGSDTDCATACKPPAPCHAAIACAACSFSLCLLPSPLSGAGSCRSPPAP